MAHEITPWKSPGCDLTLQVSRLSGRETYSQEINEKYGEGGGLNANYRTAEAVAIAANILGRYGMVYGHDFVFKTGHDAISFDFRDKETRETAEAIFRDQKVL